MLTRQRLVIWLGVCLALASATLLPALDGAFSDAAHGSTRGPHLRQFHGSSSSPSQHIEVGDIPGRPAEFPIMHEGAGIIRSVSADLQNSGLIRSAAAIRLRGNEHTSAVKEDGENSQSNTEDTEDASALSSSRSAEVLQRGRESLDVAQEAIEEVEPGSTSPRDGKFTAALRSKVKATPPPVQPKWKPAVTAGVTPRIKAVPRAHSEVEAESNPSTSASTNGKVSKEGGAEIAPTAVNVLEGRKAFIGAASVEPGAEAWWKHVRQDPDECGIEDAVKARVLARGQRNSAFACNQECRYFHRIVLDLTRATNRIETSK